MLASELWDLGFNLWMALGSGEVVKKTEFLQVLVGLWQNGKVHREDEPATHSLRKKDQGAGLENSCHIIHSPKQSQYLLRF